MLKKKTHGSNQKLRTLKEIEAVIGIKRDNVGNLIRDISDAKNIVGNWKYES